MVGMITYISDPKDTPFLSIDKTLSNKIKFSSLILCTQRGQRAHRPQENPRPHAPQVSTRLAIVE